MNMTSFRTTRLPGFVGRLSALSALALSSAFALQAQSLATGNTATPEPSVQLAANDTPGTLDLAYHAGVDYSSSSSSLDGVDPTASGRLDLAVDPSAIQPPPRRRYGRPRYNDSSHNADGSNKYAFLAGAGLTLATGDTFHYLNTNYAFQIGAGRNFNKHFSLMAQFDYDRFGFNGRTLYQQSYLYDPNASEGILGALDGSSHVWSFTVDPTYNYYQSDTKGAYVVGGVGFYHKTANFTVQEQGYEYYFGELIPVVANETIDKYSSNAPGFNGGFGFTYKPSRFANERFYAEARYVVVLNSQRSGLTFANSGSYGYPNNPDFAGNNYFPANSNRTTYVPIKFGIRF